jgi:hypothetical protein
MRIHFWLAMIVTMLVLGAAYGQTMPQQQNCTTTTSGSISHTYCGPPVVVQVQAPAVTVQAPAVTVQPAPVVVQPAPKPQAVEKKIRE